MSFRLEPRGQPPRWLSPLLTVLAVVVALLIGAAVLALVGGDPVRSYLHIVDAAFGVQRACITWHSGAIPGRFDA